jgi:hypothetical protein
MIVFDLSCKHGHAFEGWFQSPSNYDDQLEKRLIACPYCGSAEIRRVPSAVHLGNHSEMPAKSAEPKSAVPKMPATYQQLLAALISSSEYVGSEFVEEARKIHYLEAPERSIHGEASDDDYEMLTEEGINVLRLPFRKNEKLN